MKFLSIFGRNGTARDRQTDLKNVRRSSRTSRLNFRRQLRGLTCFSTAEKTPQCDHEQKQKRKRGLLSQRLRLTESSENQAASSLDVMSQLVLRPSTCPPCPPPGEKADAPAVTEMQICGDVHAERQIPPRALSAPGTQNKREHADNATGPDSSLISQGPSSITVDSLDEEQLSAYLQLAFQRCENEKDHREPSDETVQNESSVPSYDPSTQELQRKQTLALREKCRDLINRHEVMLGPIVTSCAMTMPDDPSMEDPEDLSTSCTPQDPVKDDSHADDCAKPYWTTDSGGVWKMVIPKHPERNTDASDEEQGVNCAHANEDSQTHESLGDNLFAPAAGVYSKTYGGCEFSPQLQTISESNTEHVLAGMKDGIELCTSHPHSMRTFQTTSDDQHSYHEDSGWSQAFYDGDSTKLNGRKGFISYQHVSPAAEPFCNESDGFHDWERFFPRRTDTENVSYGREPDKSDALIARPTGAVSPVTVHRLAAGDWLPASCWWGRSLLLEVMLHSLPPTVSFISSNSEVTTPRPVALLEALNPLSSQLNHVGLQRLVEDLSEGSAKGDERQVAWMTQPELPQLFVFAGFGPEDMTRWLLEVPQEMIDDQVMTGELPVHTSKAETPDGDPEGRTADTDCEQKELDGSGVHRVQEAVNLAAGELQPVEPETREVILQETDISTMETPFTQFAAGWTTEAAGRATDEPRYSLSLQNIADSRLNVHAKEFRPLCCDPCTFVPSKRSTEQTALAKKIASESDAAYDTYETKQWWERNDTGEDVSSSSKSAEQPPSSGSPAAPDSLPCTQTAAAPDPVSEYDSETEIGEHLPQILKDRKPMVSNSHIHVRNASVRPVDSEVDIIQVLDEQNGYMNFGESTQAPMSTAYQSLPLLAVDSETEMGLALPLTDPPQLPDERSHRRVRLYDSETEMAELVTSINGVDSETDIGRRVEKLAAWPQQADSHQTEDFPVSELKECDSELGMGGSDYPTPFPDRQEVVGSSSMSRLPATPVQVDSETEMGVVLNMFEQGLLPSRYFAGVEPSEDTGGEIIGLASSDSDINITIPGEHEDDEVQIISRSRKSTHIAVDQINSTTTSETEVKASEQSLDQMYNTSKSLSKAIIKKALKMFEETAALYPISSRESTAFGPTTELEGIEAESSMVPSCSTVQSEDEGEGACNPERIIPEVSVTTSDGSFVVLFPSQPVEHANYYETEERLLLKVTPPIAEQDPNETFLDAQSNTSVDDKSTTGSAAVTESRGFQPTGDSLSERELERRLLAGRCAEAAVLRKHRNSSPRMRASDEGGLRVLYRAENAESWSTVSPEGLSGLALEPVDPELADVKWRKNSRDEDGEPEQPCFGGEGEGEAAPPPPNESQSQTELSKSRPPPAATVGANSWC